MKHTLVIGIGNTLRCDDGVGVEVATQFAKNCPEHVSVITAQQLLPEHIEDIRHADCVIFVDASVSLPAGDILQQTMYPSSAPQRFSHHMTPEQILWNSRFLFGSVPEAYLLTIGVRQTEIIDSMSACIEHTISEMLNVLSKMVGS